MNTLINITAEPTKREFISYRVKRKSKDYKHFYLLYKTEYVYYPYANNLAVIPVLENNFLESIDKRHKLFEMCEILYLANESIKKNIKI